MGATALVALALFPLRLSAQYMPVGTIAATDPAECSALSNDWSAYQSGLTKEHEDCLNANKANNSNQASTSQSVCSRTACQSLHDRLFNSNLDAIRQQQLDECHASVQAYQQRKQQERQQAEERAAQAKRDAESSDNNQASQKQDSSSKDDKKSAFERDVEAYNKETERLAELTAERNAQAHQLDRATAKANKKLSAEAEKTASTNKDVLTRLAELGDSLGHSKDLGSGKAGTDQAPAFDFAGGDATLDKTLAAAGLVVPPFASIPFSMVSNAFRAELGLMNQVAAAVRDFDHLDPSFANRNFAAEFGQQVFSPSEFLRTVATHTASGLVDEYVVKPTAEHVADVVAGPSTGGSSYVLRPIAVNRDGGVSAVKPGEIPAEPHWVGTVTSSVAGQTTAAQVSRKGEYVIYWAPLRYQSGAELTQSFRHWWVSEAVDGGLSAAVDRLLNPGER